MGIELSLVFAGGAAGTAVRAAAECAWLVGPGAWPWTTFAINVLGSFLLGVLVAALAARGPDEGSRRLTRLALGTGVLGGFTTYSTFILETDELLRDGWVLTSLGYAVLSVVLGIAAAAVGVLIGRGRPTDLDPEEA